MAFPNFKNKHLEEALFHPEEFIAYKKIEISHLPKKYLLIYDKKLLARLLRKYKLRPDNKLNRVLAHVRSYTYKDISIIKINGIGSPHAVTVFEELIALGGKLFISIGTAGGLQQEGIFLCEKAIRDEGTSSHYEAHEKYAYPDKILTDNLEKSLKYKGLNFKRSTSWTIDAPYRETKAEIKQYKEEGVATVDMEASALFAVARLRKVKIASAFIVSDVLGEKWEPKFHHFNTKKGLNDLVEASLHCLSNINL